MCGIAGTLSLGSAATDLTTAVRAMAAAQAHRGPDADGLYTDRRVVLGHRRLSIIDLRATANQPMVDASGRYVITFNGEIYNYVAIRDRLRDYPFRSSADTEVILAAFARWGSSAIAALKGQFALAVWDREREALFLARDRLGEKPLYYHHAQAKHFAFASELRALLRSNLVPSRISRRGVADYLVNESVRSPHTIVADVYQIPAGHYAWVSSSGLDIQQYWSPVSGEPQDIGSYPQVCERVRHLLGNAVEGQMGSDVPLGVFLSGGIDSSAIVGLMATRSTRPVDTVSVTFDESRYDESIYSQLVADRFHTNHHVVRLGPRALLDELPAYFASVDAPSGDGPNTYVVSKAARRAGLTVALSGVGGDELFGGYKHFGWHRRYRSHDYLWRVPRRVRRWIAPTARALAPNANLEKLERLLLLGRGDVEGFYELVRSAYSTAAAGAMAGVAPPAVRAAQVDIGGERFRKLHPVSQLSILELAGYTQNVLLKDTDNLAMACSLEIRAPFCDHELVEFVLAVPDRMKYGGAPKRLLVDSLGSLLPDRIVHRPKMGFGFPWAEWIRTDLREFCDTNLRSLGERELIDASPIQATWKSFLAGEPATRWSQVWLLVTLEQWIRKTGVSVT